MQTSANGRALIESFEGLRLTAYRDTVGILTIGYGHTANVFENETITQEDADNMLAIDLHQAENAVTKYIHVPLTQNQFDALVSFTFNVGSRALQNSTLVKLLNQGNYAWAANQFLDWDKAGGQVSLGLQRRRQAEQALFLTPVEVAP